MRQLKFFATITVLLFSSLYPAAISAAEEIETTTVEELAPPVKVIPPVMVNPLKAKTIKVKTGRVVVFRVENPEIWRGKVINSSIAKFVPGGPQSTYETNPSLTILKKGKTSVSLTDGKKTYLLKLTVL
ncbi:MAG: hypothetical protein RL359_926 [Actinomycetota bacterium]